MREMPSDRRGSQRRFEHGDRPKRDQGRVSEDVALARQRAHYPCSGSAALLAAGDWQRFIFPDDPLIPYKTLGPEPFDHPELSAALDQIFLRCRAHRIGKRP